ncbi:MAG: pepsin/retropepsin-like aspartic protease family protein [Candidatus Acidiferrales bacterium]
MVKSKAALQVAKLILLPALLFVSPPGWSQSCKVVQSAFSDDAVFLATQVNDGREFWLAIDSGSNFTLVSPSVYNEVVRAAVLLRPHPPFFSFSGVRLTPNPRSFAREDLGTVRATTHHQVDGLLGDELLRNFVVQINYEKEKVVLCSRGIRPDGPLGRKVTIQSRDFPLLAVVRAQLQSKGKKTSYGELELDTGGAYVVALLAPFVSRHPEVHTPGEIPFRMGGLNGVEPFTHSSLAEVRVDGFVIHNPTVELDGPRDTDSRSQADGLLGTYFFREFTVTFNYGSNYMFLKPNKLYRQPSRN